MITNSKQKRWRFLYPLALVLGCLLLAATPAYAQGEVEISGVVTDNLGGTHDWSDRNGKRRIYGSYHRLGR